MKRLILLTFVSICAFPTHAQERLEGDTSIAESAYQILPSRGDQYHILVTIVAANPFEDRFASHPTVQITLRGADGSVISTQRASSAGIPPKGRIAFRESLYATELPAKVELRPLRAEYQTTVFRPGEFKEFKALGMKVREEGSFIRVTGELLNPYPGDTGVWITMLFRDDQRKLLGGFTKYQSDLPKGDPMPFEFEFKKDEIPSATKSTEWVVFSHNNFQDSWQKLLRP